MKKIKYLNKLSTYLPLAFLALLASCAKPPEYPIEPVIEFLSLSKDTMNRAYAGFQGQGEATDFTEVTFSFTDGDGDIGETDQLYIIDTRNDPSVAPKKLGIPVVPELGASNGIKGKITAKIFTVCCSYNDPLAVPCVDIVDSIRYQPVIFELYMLDRKGHESNKIQLPPIVIKCDYVE